MKTVRSSSHICIVLFAPAATGDGDRYFHTGRDPKKIPKPLYLRYEKRINLNEPATTFTCEFGYIKISGKLVGITILHTMTLLKSYQSGYVRSIEKKECLRNVKGFSGEGN